MNTYMNKQTNEFQTQIRSSLRHNLLSHSNLHIYSYNSGMYTWKFLNTDLISLLDYLFILLGNWKKLYREVMWENYTNVMSVGKVIPVLREPFLLGPIV